MQILQTRTVIATMFGVFAAVAAPAAADPPQPRPTIAIVDFDAAPGGWTLPPPRLGALVAQLMLDRLVSSDQFHVLDGQWLQYGNRRPTPDAPARLRADAEASGVDYLVFGSISRFSTENRQRSLGGAALVVPLLGGFRRQKSEMVIALTVRIIDVRSGEVVATATGQGNATRTKVASGGLGFLRAGGAGGFSDGASDFRDAQLDEAIQRSVAAAAEGVTKSAPRLVRGRAKPEATTGAPPGLRDR